MISKPVKFKGSLGFELDARLELPDADPVAYAIFAHCFACSKDVMSEVRIAKELTNYGLAVLRFDFTGLGCSGGEFGDTTFSSNVDDLMAASNFLSEYDKPPVLLVGHSLGGAAVLAASGKIPSIKALATIGAPSEPEHIKNLFARQGEVGPNGEVEISMMGKSFNIGPQFLHDVTKYNLKQAVSELHKPLLIFHSPNDQIVGIENAREIYEAAKHPKSFVSLKDADHMLSSRDDARYVARVLAAWASRYLDLESANTMISDLPEGTVIVKSSSASKFAQRIFAGHHQMIADEPVLYGGKDRGPSPYGYLLSALGSCTAMTVQMYAQRKGIALESVSVTLSHQKIHADDCINCEEKSGKLDEIEIVLELTGDLSEDERQKLLEIANKCPVHRTLASENSIKTVLAEGR